MTDPEIVAIGTIQAAELADLAHNAADAAPGINQIGETELEYGNITRIHPNTGTNTGSEGALVLTDQLLVWVRDVEEAADALGVLDDGVTPAATFDLTDEVTPNVAVLHLDQRFMGLPPRERVVRALLQVREAGYRVSFNHVVEHNGPSNVVPPLEVHMTVKGSLPPRALVHYALPNRPRLPAFQALVDRLFRRLHLPLLWRRLFRLPLPVKVAVLDTGVRSPLTGSARPRTDGWLNDVTGDDDPWAAAVVDQSAQPGPGFGHGTAVAGVVQQVAPHADVVSYQVLEQGVSGEVPVAQAIIRAASGGADIINLSLGTQAMLEHAPLSIEDALLTIPDHVLVVAAAGNSANFDLTYPAAHKRVLAVGATKVEDPHTAASYTTRGSYVGVSSVGSVATTFVPCTLPVDSDGDGNLDVISGPNPTTVATGTSFATPKISGQLALYLSQGMDPDAAVDALRVSGSFEPDLGYVIDILEQ
jgi:hypothetical protein